MNFCIHDSKIKDYTRPIQGGKNIAADSTEKSQTQTFNQGPQMHVQPYQEFKTQQEQSQYQEQYQEQSQSQSQEQYQLPQEQSQPIERKHKPLQLQSKSRSRFQARRRDVRQVDVPPQAQPLSQEIKVDNEFGYSIEE